MAGKLVAEDVPHILARREHGETAQALASSYNVSVSMIYNVLHGWMPPTRAEIEDLAERRRLAAERGLKSYVRKPYDTLPRRARSALTRAIASGAVTREPCFLCGKTEVEGHHHNGYGPEHELDVVWLCSPHHKEAHVKIRASQKIATHPGSDETPVSDTVDTSTAAACVPVPHHWCSTHQQRLVTERQCAATVSRETPIDVIPLPYEVTPEQIAFKRAEYERIKPSFLAAPDDDCAACGHDRQTYHLNAGGVCRAPAPNTRSRRCDCPSYVSAAEPF